MDPSFHFQNFLFKPIEFACVTTQRLLHTSSKALAYLAHNTLQIQRLQLTLSALACAKYADR